MPNAPPKPCRVRDCGNVTTDKSRYCPEHSGIAKGQKSKYNNNYNQNIRPWSTKKRDKRYSSMRWKLLRKIILSRDPVCKICIEMGRANPSQEVDHKTPVYKGGEFFDKNNLQGLCKVHHKYKSGLDRRGIPKNKVVYGYE